MGVNKDTPAKWAADTAASVDMYNKWFFVFAPEAFQATRKAVAATVENSLKATDYLRNILPETLRNNPSALSTLRMCTCPPIAVDRLTGLSGAPGNLVGCMEEGALPARMATADLMVGLKQIADTIERLADQEIFPWLANKTEPQEREIFRATTIVADRLCGAIANPIVRNAQETRQLQMIKDWLVARGYRQVEVADRGDWMLMQPGTFSFRLNVPVQQIADSKAVNIPVDAVVMPLTAKPGDMPLLIEAKSAGDFTNTNKRRKEEAVKFQQLKATYGANVRFILFLCGYFGDAYLRYSAAEELDWVWEHRMDDLALMGL